MVNPDPFASIAGVTAGITDVGDIVFTDAFTITWGRAGVLDAPTPATASLRLLDRSPGATLARRTDLLGTEVQLGYMATRGDTYGPSLSFRGRITDVVVERRHAGGYYVHLAASSREVEAANYTAPAGAAWPAETFAQRLARIMGLLPDTLLRSASRGGPVVLPGKDDFGPFAGSGSYFLNLSDYNVAPATPGGADALTLLKELFASTSPLPMVYDPGNNALTFAGRRRFGAATSTAPVLTSSLTAPAGRDGLYVATALAGYDLDANDIDTLGQLDQPLDSRLTRVEVSYLDSSASYARATVTAATPDAVNESTTGRRTLSVSSIHADTVHAQGLANMYRDVAAGEARAPRLAPLSFRTALNHGFTSTGQRDALLNGSEQSASYFLSRSFLPDLGVRPILGVVGGSISYGAGEWSLILNPAAVAVDTPWAPVTSATAPNRLLRELHPSFTFGDAAFLDS